MDNTTEQIEKALKGRVILLGVGNTLRGDDAFGSLLAAGLNGKVSFKVLDAGITPENYLTPVINEAPDAVLLVDAVDFGGNPGDVKLIDASQVKTVNFYATHNMSLSLFFRFLNDNINVRAYLLAVQPERIGFNEAMTPKLEGTLARLQAFFLERYANDKRNN